MFRKLLAASLFTFALMAFINTQASSQSMYFCEDVDSDGYPISESSTFNIGSNGGYLKVLIRLPYELNSYTAKYVIYRNGDYDNTIYQDAEKDWTWFWQKITFYKSGDYDIYAYDGNDNLLTSGYLRINMR
jgi:hypothetical protein